MRVGLIDIDRTSWRNLRAMREGTYRKRRGDELLFQYDGAQKVDKTVITTVFTRNLVSRGKEYRKGRSPSTVDEWLRLLTGGGWRLESPWDDTRLWRIQEVSQLAQLMGFDIGENGLPKQNEKLPRDFQSYAPLYDVALRRWNIEIGGTGWNIHSKASPEIEACKPDYSLYDKYLGPANYGQGFTTRGCPRGCHFCVVPKMSGGIITPMNTLADLQNGEFKFIKLMDDNFWAPQYEPDPDNPGKQRLSPNQWWRDRMEEAIRGGFELSYTQGLDIRYVDEERAALLSRVNFWNEGHTTRQVTFAFDSPRIEKLYRRGFELLIRAGIKPYQIASFVLMGFDSTPEEDDFRLAVLRELGADPFAMVYEPINGETVPAYYVEHPEVLAVYGEHLTLEQQYQRHWHTCKDKQRWSNHKAIWKTVKNFADYEPNQKRRQRWSDEDGQAKYFFA